MGKLQEKTNNPMNVRYDVRNNWIGQCGQVQGFCKFKNTMFGYRAALKVIIAYMKRGMRTLSQIISTYAPPSENNTDAYIHTVSEKANLQPDEVITTWPQLFRLVLEMARVESGTNPDASAIYWAIGWCEPELKKLGIDLPVIYN